MNFLPWRPYGNRQNPESVARPAGALPAASATDGANGAEPSASGGAARARVEIVAWRAWSLNDGFLWSTAHPCRWNGPVFRADVVPERANTHGVYAVKALHHAPHTSAWGEVALSGIVVEAEAGYRAEVATIRSLFVGRRHEQIVPDGYHAGYTFEEWPSAALVAALEERYKVDVTVAEPRRQEGAVINYIANQVYALQQAQLTPQPIFYSTGITQAIANNIFNGLGGNASGF